MVVLVALTVGLIIWIVGWSFGYKAVDVFLITLFLVVNAAAYVMVKPFIDRMLRRDGRPGDERA